MKHYRFLLLASLLWLSPAVAADLDYGQLAPEFTLTTLSGETFVLSDYRHKMPVYLVFWASWCAACTDVIPGIRTIFNNHKQRVKLLAINIGYGDTPESIVDYLKKHQVEYDIAFDDNLSVYRLYGVSATPTQIIIDINGNVRYIDHWVPEDFEKKLSSISSIES